MPFHQRHGATVAFVAGADIFPNRFVKFGSSDDAVIQATAPTDMVIGVSYIPNSVDDPYPMNQARPPIKLVAGDTIDVVIAEYPQVEYGGTVVRGNPVTANADGKAVAAASGNQIYGYAGFSAVAGDVGPVFLQRATRA